MATLKVKADDAEQIVYGDHDEWKNVEGTEEITDQGRWSTSFEGVFYHTPSNKFYLFQWEKGSTECQDGTEMFPWADNEGNIEVYEVHKVERVVEVWEAL